MISMPSMNLASPRSVIRKVTRELLLEVSERRHVIGEEQQIVHIKRDDDDRESALALVDAVVCVKRGEAGFAEQSVDLVIPCATGLLESVETSS